MNDVNFSYKGTASIAGFVKLDPDGSGDGSDPGGPSDIRRDSHV